jgi:hypothetical protein
VLRKFGAAFVTAIALAGLASSRSAHADEPSVTPYRPTVSNPAQLPVAGWLEVEMGINKTHPGDGSRQSNVPYLLKYAFNEDFGILLGGDAHLSQTDVSGERRRGFGDTLLLAKHRWGLGEENDDSALGLEWGFKSPTARNGLGNGATDYLINGIYSTEFRGHSLDLNLSSAYLGAIDPGTGRTRWGWAASISRPLNEQWSLAAELSGVARRGTSPETQGLFALAYALSKRVVLDAGFTIGLSRAAADKGFFVGASVLLEKLR